MSDILKNPLSSENIYVRNPNVSLITGGQLLVLIRRDFVSTVLGNVTNDDIRIIQTLSKPRSADEISAHLKLSNDLVYASLQKLTNSGAVVKGTPSALRRLFAPQGEANRKICKKLVWGICGTIQAVGLIGLLPFLKMAVADEVDVILTQAATRFVRPEVVNYLGGRVWTDPYAVGFEAPVSHMHLAETADAVLILPASASTIAKLASGACCDLLSLVCAATRAPIIVAPSMNPSMIGDPAVARNIDILRNDGKYIVETGIGTAASDAQQIPSFISAGLKDGPTIASALRSLLGQNG